MFSLAISSICDCSRARSPSMAAASSGSASTSGAEKNPGVRSTGGATADEIDRTAPHAKGRRRTRKPVVVYHILGAVVSYLQAVAFGVPIARSQPLLHRACQVIA
jgi:hypothetical protein